jgi:Na+-translocating ferredoxin:NAD+ oxidoreductase subunit G
MSAEHPIPDPAPVTTATGAMIRTLGLVSAICGLIIVATYQVTFDAVAANKRLALERSVFRVMPAAKSIAEYQLAADGRVSEVASNTPAGGIRFFAAYDAQGKFLGVAAEGAAKGYADTVRIMFGYDPDTQHITGIGVVAMRETPGIGDRIISDPAFLANFTALDARLNADLSALSNEIRTVKHGSKNQAWQIDAISGATITSRAVGKAINDAAQALLPKLQPKLNSLRKSS